MASLASITDSSSDLLPEEAAAAGVRLVPLSVSFGDETFAALTELSNEAFYQRLTAPGAPLPRTAAPNPSQFASAIRAAFEAGASSVICMTISADLSATYAAAVQGAAEVTAAGVAPGAVEVIDTRSVTRAQALMVTEAAALARAGATHAEVVARVTDLIGRTRIVFTVDTLEYLQRGGRIGRASAFLGSVLSIKPILGLSGGVVVPVDRRRTAAKARARILEILTERAVERATVLHTVTPGIEALRDEVVEATGLDAAAVDIGLVGPVAGTHVGPGMYGVAFITASGS
jgi:DegV family protein with EDD domain